MQMNGAKTNCRICSPQLQTHTYKYKCAHANNLIELVIDHMLVLNGVKQIVGCHVTLLKQ